MSIRIVSFLRELLGFSNPRHSVEIKTTQQLVEVVQLEQQRCNRRQADWYAVESAKSVSLTQAQKTVEVISDKLTLVDIVGRTESGRLIVICSGASRELSESLAKTFSERCSRQGLELGFEVVSRKALPEAGTSELLLSTG